MMSKKPGALASALRKSGATVAAAPAAAEALGEHPPAELTRATQSSRKDTAPITVHLHKAVRQQLKVLAAEQERNVEDVVAEALNLVFAKYRKPEIAPRK
jgi:hypothetical protein